MATKTKQWADGSSATIQYDGQGDGHIIITSDPNEHYEARSMQITVGTTDGSGIQRVVTINQAAKQRIDLSAAVVTAATQTYSGSALTPTPTVTLNGTTIPSTGYDVSYSDNTNAGTANITITGKGDYTGTATGTFTINKAAGVAGVSGISLTYSRNAQNLVTVSGNTGTVHYRLGTSGTWSTTIPTATNASANAYVIYYYVDASDNYEAVGSESSPYNVSTTIAKRTPVLSISPSLRTGLSYTGSAQNLLSGGAMKHSSSNSTSVAGTFTYDQGTNAGDYSNPYWYFTPNDTTNYNSTSGYINGTVTISKISASVTAAPTAKSLTYTGSAQALVNAGTASGGTMYYKYTTTNSKPTSTSGFSSSIPTRTTAGTYYVWYYVYGDSNHTSTSISSTAVSVTIAKKSRTISWSSYPSSLAVGQSGTLSATASAGGSDGTISYSSSNSSRASVSGSTVTAVSQGSCTIYASISEGTNYLSASTSYSLTVTKAVPAGFVDMGVSVFWAEKNIGAPSIYSYDCLFFSWGNTDGHAPTSDTSFSPYSWGGSNSTSPYSSSSGAALTGNIPTSNDAARQNLGSPNRMPTSDEFLELFNNVKYIDANGNEVSGTNKLVTVNGVVGLYLESKINGNRLFLPCTGNGDATLRRNRGSIGFYWSSTLYDSTRADSLGFASTVVAPNDRNQRFYGFAIRPVQPA